MYVLALYLEKVRGYDAFTAGLLLLPSTVSMLVFIPIGARLELRRGPRFPLATGTMIMGVGTFLTGFLTTSTPYWWYAAADLHPGRRHRPLLDAAQRHGRRAGAAGRVGRGVGRLQDVQHGRRRPRRRRWAASTAASSSPSCTATPPPRTSRPRSSSRSTRPSRSSEKAQEIYEDTAADVRAKVDDAVTTRALARHRRLAHGRGDLLGVLAVHRRAGARAEGHPGTPDRQGCGRRDAPPAGPSPPGRYPRRTACRILCVRSPGAPARHGEVSELA